MKISDKSSLQVDFSYFQEGGKTVWDVSGMTITEEKYNQMSYVVYRMKKPPKELGDQYQSNWENMVERKFPYNRSAYYKDKVTIISTTYNRDSHLDKGETPSSPVLYTIGFVKEGKVDQKEMEARLDLFMRNLVIYEKGENKGEETGSRQPES